MIVDSSDNRILSHSDHQNDGKILAEAMKWDTQTLRDPDSLMVTRKKQEMTYEISAPMIIKDVHPYPSSIAFP